MPAAKRAIRIAGSSGGFSDRQRAIGDWLSERTMALHSAQKTENDRMRRAGELKEEPAGLLVEDGVKTQGLDLTVGWVSGDGVTDTVKRLYEKEEECYFGGAGVAEALRQGCDIVIAGRVADAAPTIGASMWRHGWNRETDLDQIKDLTCLKFTLNGYSPENPRNQEVSTVDFRIFVQNKNKALVDKFTLDVPGFNRWCMENFLQSCPGATLGNDQRQSEGKPFYEYYVTLLPQSEVKHRVELPWDDRSLEIPTKHPVDLATFGPTTRGPLGWIVEGRSGDKASDANVGFYLLEGSNKGKEIERFEIPGIRAVHFLVRDHLDRGFNSASEYDTLGKNICEYLRAKYVELPSKFLRRGSMQHNTS
ncbi:hypothetical protein B0T10DRAFT_576273 [Thelonectria olida]|uniref:Uncharacterized protein n=1 Tax=Thelonectria olida TaxID=1576542 RepID=A0A9P9AQP8_9HYPO|nr:hypothetical protein B0T10DRAFT_576273 [Thelonectria olida]